MKDEVETGVRFLSRVLNRSNKLNPEQVERFRECLLTILCEHFQDHWYPENPIKGQGYRCIRINRKQHVDNSLLKACKDCGLDYSQLDLPREISIWIDPGSVSCRLGENNHYFTVKKEETTQRSPSGKASPELETSDYHSESPSESSSEDEGPAKKGAVTPVPSRSWSAEHSAKQVPQYFYMPNPLWVPFQPQHMVSYVPAYHPLTVYYFDVSSTKSLAPKTRNPNLVKRLTKRATRA